MKQQHLEEISACLLSLQCAYFHFACLEMGIAVALKLGLEGYIIPLLLLDTLLSVIH